MYVCVLPKKTKTVYTVADTDDPPPPRFAHPRSPRGVPCRSEVVCFVPLDDTKVHDPRSPCR